ASTVAVKAAAATGDAPAVLSELAVAGEVATGELVVVPVSDLDLERTLRAVWLPTRRPQGPVADLVRTAKGSR
ncbi:MAG: LysR substrate-binding domain-containing protein, partial [Nocardioides sp.]